MPTDVEQARNRVANATRTHGPKSPEVVAARSSLATEKIAAFVKRVVAEAPPLSDEQRDKIVHALGSGPRLVGKLVDDPLLKKGSANIPNQLEKTGSAVTR